MKMPISLTEIKAMLGKPYRTIITFLVATASVVGIILGTMALAEAKIVSVVDRSRNEPTFRAIVQSESRAVWAEEALKARLEHQSFNSTLQGHEKRLAVLEQQSNEIMRKLDVIATEVGYARGDIQDLKRK